MSDFRPVGEWPRLLAGPMVRRVTMQRAHVFIATKMACTANLVVYQGRVSHNGPAVAIATGPSVALDRIGERLFVTVLQVDLPVSVTPGATLSYDVLVTESGTTRNLFQLGLLGGTQSQLGSEFDVRRVRYPLGYAEGMLPSFVLPADHPSEVRLVHASCRKPHGGGTTEPDALTLVDAAISQSIDGTVPEATRPQQLILTGDQIYADDVASGLLRSLIGAGEQLIGWDETLPLLDPVSDFVVQPGWRTRYLSIAGVDLKELPATDDAFDYSQSHLLRFSEWAAMYLFAWSDALWPLDDMEGYDLPDPDARLPTARIEQALDLADTIGLVAVPARVARALQVATWLSEFQDQLERVWEETKDKAIRYARSVPSIRRALANCATYTMFDDHEITDDWYVSRRVHDRLKGAGSPPGTMAAKLEVGPRLLRNGLSAYAIFQHWGNAPDDFAPGAHGRALLDMWRFTGASAGCRLKAATRDADTILGIVPGDSPIPAGGRRNDFVRFRWDYAIDFPAHRLLALDTRTWRYFPPGEPFTWTSLAPLIPNPPGGAATSGAAQLTALANAWRTARTQSGAVVMGHFASLIDDFVAIAGAVDESRDQLRARAITLSTDFDAFLDALPNRASIVAAQLADPGATWLNDFFRGPTLVGAILDQHTTKDELVDFLVEVLHHAADYDFGPLAYDLQAVFEALADFVDTAFSRSTVGMVHSAHRAAQEAGTDLWNLFTTVPTSHSSFTNFRAALQVVLGDLDALTQATGLDRLGAAIFRDGSTRLAPGLIREDALPFMVTSPIATIGPGKQLTFILSPAPLIGNQLVETAQRLSVVRSTAAGEAGEEELDFEPWTGNEPAMIWFFEAARALRTAIVLSGDVHYAGSSVTQATTAHSRGRYIQFTSSAARNSDGKTRGLGTLDDLLYDDSGRTFFQQADWAMLLQAGSSSLTHLERLARSRVESALQAMTDAVDNPTDLAREIYERASNWWFSSRITLDDVVETAQSVVLAPPNTVRAMMQEAAWQLYAAVETIQEFADDPILKMFGDFLTAPAPLRAQLRQFYSDVGLDPHNGLTLPTSILIDRRPDRLGQYPALNARYTAGTAERELAEAKYRRTVGHANVGFISCETRGDDVMRVIHELRWFPHDEPERRFNSSTGRFDDPIPRFDWFGTRHVAGFRGPPAPGAP